MTDTVQDQVVATPSENVDVEITDYDKAFDAAVAKREAEKDGTAEVVEPDTEPAKEAATEEPSSEAKEPAKEAATKVQDDEFLATLPEAARARFAAAEEKARKLDLDNRSLAGRMSAYQRRYEEAAGKRPADVAKAATVEQTEQWKQFKEDYPDISSAIEDRFAAASPTTSSPAMKDVVEYVEQQKRERFLTDAWDAVEAVHAGWRETGKTKDFQEWMQSSPTYGKLASSDDIADAIALFDLYEGTGTRSHPQTDPAQAAATAQLAARRGAQLDGARSPTNRAQAPNETVDLQDPEQLFAFYAAKSDKRLKDQHR